MDPKLYKFLEFIFIGGLLVAVLYLGGLFSAQPLQPTAGAPLHSTAAATSDLTDFETRRIELTLTARAAPPASSIPNPSATPVPALTPTVYQVAAGDTCTAIAVRFGVSLQSLMELNGLDADCLILAGGTLKIPLPAPAAP
jgi:LysM repeat protein